MAQADLNVANQSGSAFRADLNNQLLALGTQMSGASAPGTTFAYMLWADTANGLLKQRNAANSDWITVRNLDGTYARGSAANPSIPFDGGTGIYSLGEDQVAIATGGTGRLFVDASGRILVGVSTALTNAYAIGTALAPAVQLEGNTGNAAALSITRHASAAANLLLQRGVIGTPVVDTDAVGQISFNGFDGTNYFNAALIRGVVDGTPGANSMPGRLSFQTTPTGSTTPVERLRLDPAGQILAASLGTAALPVWSFTGDPNTGLMSPTADTLAVSTGGNERFRVDSSGRLLVGTTSTFVSGANLQVAVNGGANTNRTDILCLVRTGGTAGASGEADRSGWLTFGDKDNFTLTGGIGGYRVDPATYASGLRFAVWDAPGGVAANSAADLKEAMRLDSSGNLLVGKTSTTANGGVLQVSNGITFPGTQSACSDPNTLDDYEEGTWTPTIIGSSTAGTATYAVQNARYTKTGRVVFIEFYLVWSGGTGTGNLLVSGLPFTVANAGTYSSLSVGSADQVALTANNYPGAYVNSNATTITLVQHPTGGGGRTQIPYDAQAELVISGTYTVA